MEYLTVAVVISGAEAAGHCTVTRIPCIGEQLLLDTGKLLEVERVIHGILTGAPGATPFDTPKGEAPADGKTRRDNLPGAVIVCKPLPLEAADAIRKFFFFQ